MQRFTARRPQQPRSTPRSTRLILLLPFRTVPGHHTRLVDLLVSLSNKQGTQPAEATGPAAIFAFPYNGLCDTRVPAIDPSEPWGLVGLPRLRQQLVKSL